MEFCGGHTRALSVGALTGLPAAIQMIHGPGCPVRAADGRIQQAIDLVLREPVILCSYYDMRCASRAWSQKSRCRRVRKGADVRVVYSTEDALAVARQKSHATGRSVCRRF